MITVYVPNDRTLKCIKQKLTELKQTINKFTITLEELNNPLSVTGRKTRVKKNQ